MLYYRPYISVEEGDYVSSILIVEDDVIIGKKIEQLIIGMGKDIKVIKAKDGTVALQIADNIAIDIFIIDIKLPDYDGIELAKKFRKNYPYSPIIIESSKGDSVFQNIVHDQIGNLAFLKKPFLDSKLIAKVNDALGLVEHLYESSLKIRQNNFLRVINTKDIIYIEKIKDKKKISIVFYDRYRKRLVIEEFSGLSLYSLMDKLENKNELLRCHKSFIINPKMIERLNYVENTLILKYTEIEIPIGKTYKAAINYLL